MKPPSHIPHPWKLPLRGNFLSNLRVCNQTNALLQHMGIYCPSSFETYHHWVSHFCFALVKSVIPQKYVS
ncbi:hypothetical protein K1719_016535 [Acacia pycnantha]|nr:hypothetical protein K1719_016535 [Acacia pycnantha]